jgi:hypothetical protein
VRGCAVAGSRLRQIEIVLVKEGGLDETRWGA